MRGYGESQDGSLDAVRPASVMPRVPCRSSAGLIGIAAQRPPGVWDRHERVVAVAIASADVAAETKAIAVETHCRRVAGQ
jgi:hypothetical protein